MTNYDEIACWNALHAALRAGDGATINGDGTPFIATRGFQVAVWGELVLPDFDYFDDEATHANDDARFEIAVWLRRTQFAFEHAPYLGVWQDRKTREWAIDRSLHIIDRDEAMTTGVAFNQRAIYDWAAGRSIDCATGEYIIDD
jgi:hypothetical protein